MSLKLLQMDWQSTLDHAHHLYTKKDAQCDNMATFHG